MTTTSLTIATPRSLTFNRVWGFVELTKPRIAVLELVVVLAAGAVATWGQPDPARLASAMLGTLLVAASASAANQWLEQRQDARMTRTAARPLPTGRLTSTEALSFAAAALAVGSVQLALFVNVASCLWALLTWCVYVLAYTPLKTVSPLNTVVGAVAGAMPVFIGWSATGVAIDQRTWALALLLFLWQFPHFMAIAWLYRLDYARAGYKMLTVVDPTGRRAGWQATLAALAIIPVSIVPVLASPGLGGVLYVACAAALGAGQLLLAVLFWQRTNEFAARLLLRASLVYLPTIMVTLMLAPWI